MKDLTPNSSKAQIYWATRPSTRAARPFAPAASHNFRSSLKSRSVRCRLGADPSKTQAFQCFQRIHAPRMIRELKPFLCCLGIFLQDFFHQSANEMLCRLDTKLARPRGCKMLNQNCLANTHEVRRCWIVSSSWSQSGQWAGWGNPLFFCNLSAVQQQFWIASQIKILHLLGAQDFSVSTLKYK